MRISRLAAVVSAAVLTATTLSACGSSGDDDKKASGGSSDSWTPVTIEHKYGSTTIEDKPERVVTLGLTDQDAVLALGTVPVAVTKWFGKAEGMIFPWAEDALAAAETNPLGKDELPEVLDDETVSVEKILGFQPDLVIALYSNISKDKYNQLSERVPVIAPPEGVVDYGIPWQDGTKTVGEALGKKAEAEKLVADVDAKIAAAKGENPDFSGKTAATVSAYEGIFVYSAEDPRTRLLTDLGFSFPEDLAEFTAENFGKSLSKENADMIDLDALIWVNDEAATLKDIPTYADTTAHKEGRDIFIAGDESDPIYVASSFVTALSLPFYLDAIVPRLAAAVDGDTATATD